MKPVQQNILYYFLIFFSPSASCPSKTCFDTIPNSISPWQLSILLEGAVRFIRCQAKIGWSRRQLERQDWTHSSVASPRRATAAAAEGPWAFCTWHRPSRRQRCSQESCSSHYTITTTRPTKTQNVPASERKTKSILPLTKLPSIPSSEED